MQSLPLTSFQTPTKKPFPPYYSPHNDSPIHQQKTSLAKSEFAQRDYGKAKGIEILSFKDSELERTYASQTSFIAAGTLHVIYFESYNRFILSINDWRYVLLRRMPVVGSDTRLPGPVAYTLPACDGFYTLRLINIDNMASLKNFETILANSSKFSSKENVNNSSKRVSSEYTQNISEFENAEPTPLTKSDRWKRGFRKLNSKLSNSFKRDKPNLNLYQARDFESLKRTNEIMAPLHLIPKREVDSLISMYKDVANKHGFQPETHSSGLQNCPLTPIAESRINQTAFTNPFASPAPTRARTGGSTASPQPEKAGSIGNMALNHAINAKNYGASQPKLMDRIKARIPGEHYYYGEKQPGEKIMTHSHTLRDQRRASQYQGTPRRTIKEVVERNLMKDTKDDGSLLDSFATEQDPYEVALSPKFAEHEDTLEIARQRSLELVEKLTKDYLAHKEKMSRFSTQSKMSGAEAGGGASQNSFGVDLETVDTPENEEKESCEVMLDSRSVGRREAKGLRKRVALKIDYENEESVLDLNSILRSEGLEQCEG